MVIDSFFLLHDIEQVLANYGLSAKSDPVLVSVGNMFIGTHFLMCSLWLFLSAISTVK